MNASPDLSPARRASELERLAEEPVDLVVIGGGVTGCGVALDAAARGLSVALLERHDLAHGTSRWSSKLVHGGLRYLAQAQFGVAAESARERHHLMTTIAPHLTRPLATVIPFTGETSHLTRAKLRIGWRMGDLLRHRAGTPADLLARSHRIDATGAVERAPRLRREGLAGALLGWDGQLEDDARLVVAIARTAAAHGAMVVTRCGVTSVEPGRVHAVDELSGQSLTIRAEHVINATGVWAGELADGVHVAPSKGVHVIVPAERLGNPTGSLTVPAHGGGAQFVFAIPTTEQTVVIGLTDTDHSGPIPEVPEAEPWEEDLLLETVSSVLDEPLTRDDLIGSYAGLRPLLRESSDAHDAADVSRRHAVVEDAAHGMLTLVGGKLTTYRQMAEDAVDRITERSCTTTRLPLVGAPGGPLVGEDPATGIPDDEIPARLVRRFGNEAARVVAMTGGDRALLEPVVAGSDISPAELHFAAAHELAMTTSDLLDRRTRAGLIPALRERLEDAARDALERTGGRQAATAERLAPRGGTDEHE